MKMKVYLDLYFLINYLFDFISLLTVSIILKRKVKIYKMIEGSLIGSLSMITLFIRFNSLELLLIKIIISILINIITFNYKDIRYFFNNIYYFYLSEIILGGFIFLLKNNISNNYILYLLCAILFILIFIKNIKNIKSNYNNYLNIKFDIDNKTYNLNAFLDTGNKLVDPILKIPVILINKNILNIDGSILVPYKTIEKESILKCIIGNNLYINNKKVNKKFLIGNSNNINIDGVDCLFNEKLMEGL